MQCAGGRLAAAVRRRCRLAIHCAPPANQVTSVENESKIAEKDGQRVEERPLQGHTYGRDRDEADKDRKVQQVHHRTRPALLNNASQLAVTLLLEVTVIVLAPACAGGAWPNVVVGPRPDVWEALGGHAEVSGYLAIQPLGVMERCDLRAQRNDVRRCYLREERREYDGITQHLMALLHVL